MMTDINAKFIASILNWSYFLYRYTTHYGMSKLSLSICINIIVLDQISPELIVSIFAHVIFGNEVAKTRKMHLEYVYDLYERNNKLVIHNIKLKYIVLIDEGKLQQYLANDTRGSHRP